MNIYSINPDGIRSQLQDRRKKLHSVIDSEGKSQKLVDLLKEVDLALEKFSKGTYGVCETCHDYVEQERLLVDPLARNCLDHLSPAEQRGLERDLDLAYSVQRNLLPKRNLGIQGWQTAYHYEPAGPVSGDYCDLVVPQPGGEILYFFVGDVSGKGVAASILMAHLQAIFRSLIRSDESVTLLVEQANRLFCEGTLSNHFATLVSGKATHDGMIEISNAGHCFPVLVQDDKVRTIPATSVPLGSFHGAEFTSRSFHLNSGDQLVLYSDGLTELREMGGEMYGEERLLSLLRSNGKSSPHELIHLILEDLDRFRGSSAKGDDLTILVVKKS